MNTITNATTSATTVMMKNCILAGVGGQGTVLASKLIAQAAINRGLNARTAETIGMAQRGGSVVSHVRIGEVVHSPLVPNGTADLIIGFEPSEAVRCLPYLKADGTLLISTKSIQPTTANLAGGFDDRKIFSYLGQLPQRVILIDGEQICHRIGSAKALNVALLGAAAAAGLIGFTPVELEQAIKQKVPAKFFELNLQALQAGAAAIAKDV